MVDPTFRSIFVGMIRKEEKVLSMEDAVRRITLWRLQNLSDVS